MTTLERGGTVEKFVEREIFACQSALVEEALKQNLFQVADIQNFCLTFDGRLTDRGTCARCQREFESRDTVTAECKYCFDPNQVQEIFEWWLVSPWLGEKLLLQSEPILENDYGVWWGRCTTGQAISMESVIQIIYEY